MDNDVNLHFTLLYLERDGLSIIKSLSTLLRSVIIYHKWQQKLFDSSLREVTSYPVVVLPLHAATQQVEAPVPALLVRSYCFSIKKNIDINCHFHTHEGNESCGVYCYRKIFFLWCKDIQRWHNRRVL